MHSNTLTSRTRQRPQPHTYQMGRWLTVVMLIVAGLAHIPVIPAHLSEAPYMGVLFIAFTLTALTVAALLAARPSLSIYILAVGLCVAAVVAYTATRTVAFPQLADDVGAWLEPLGVVSVLTEAAVVALGANEIRRIAASFSRTGSPVAV
jgi:hypothetical protein